ncbi:antibiotic biosynthesis monooxygenase [bacterium]|nr:antibiotic biosynthesis monooxygenase [bacterium]
MTSPLTIVARIQAREGAVELVREELLKLVPETLKEEGCLQYDLHQDTTDPRVFLFYENWESRELWLAHMESAHIRLYREKTEGAVEDFALNEMRLLAPGLGAVRGG